MGAGVGARSWALLVILGLGVPRPGRGLAELASHAAGSPTTAGNGWSQPVGLSADGRLVVFSSAATDLVAGSTDANANLDAFVYDREGAAIELLSHAAGAPTTAANGWSRAWAATPDARFVLLRSAATDLVPGGTTDADGAGFDVFVYDRQTQTAELVSHAVGFPARTGNGQSEAIAVTPDGRFVLYQSRATDLVAGVTDVNGSGYDVFVYDRQTQVTELVSRSSSSSTTTANGASQGVALSSDGRFVLLRSVATNLVTGMTDANGGLFDAFVYDRQTQTMELVSHAATSAATTGNGRSLPIAFTPDGRFVLLESLATDLVTGESDANGGTDVLLYDRQTQTAELVSHATGSPATASDNWSGTPATLSPDGRFVAFASAATNLVAGMTDANGFAFDTFIVDRQSQTMELVSHAAGSPLRTANDSSEPVTVTADGRFVLLGSAATDLAAGLADANGDLDVFVCDRQAQTVRLASHSTAGTTTAGSGHSYPVASTADGQRVLFYSDATDLAASDGNGATDAFLWSAGGPPTDPTTLTTEPPPATWSNLRTIQVNWSGAADHSGTGLAGYSVVFDHAAGTAPDPTIEIAQASDPHSTSASPLADASDWRFHLSTCDNLGQCTSTVHAGPFWLDATPPSAPGSPTSVLHGDGRAHLTPIVQISWGAASDNLSGVAGYWYGFDASPTAACGATNLGAAAAASSPPLAAGTWYAHVCAVDAAGNWGGVADGGPYVVARPGSLWFFTLEPCRLLDTRLAAGPLGGPPLAGGGARVFPLVASRCGVPPEAQALSVNLTVVFPAAPGFLTLHRGDAGWPATSNLSFAAGGVRANNAVTQVSGDGDLSVAVYNGSAGQADVVLDVSGYFAPWP